MVVIATPAKQETVADRLRKHIDGNGPRYHVDGLWACDLNAVIRQLETATAALKRTGMPKAGGLCWCGGWYFSPCVNQPQCTQAREAIALVESPNETQE